MNRRQAREKAIQALFQMDVGAVGAEEALANVTEGGRSDGFLEQLVKTTAEHLDRIDETIKKYLINWTFDRLANVDKAILRLAVCELLYFDDIPVKVTLNEAIELAKTFGDDDSHRFTNGVLAKIAAAEGLAK
ncbi:transcription antitermination factor NusB [Caenibacillus caldisaponilyticus]|uniref:transcription antitermination factor NusB n=1 Tax=Caenibacillus caldisaponilyticus TaxID=1674942 RepID=UPI0009886C36|nr:transcription antitermination factor NusB [Caenibacillus caldisaponilyticus]